MQLWRRIRYLLERGRRARELDDEISTHLAYRADRLREQGLPLEQAHLAARRQFGNRTAVELASDRAWGWSTLERFAQDVRLAVRSLRRSPGIAAVAVLTLAVGLGMNTAIFTIVNAVMLRSLPYPEPERVVCELTVREELCTAGDIIHGGAIMAFADTVGALGTVVNLREGQGTTTIESKTNFFAGSPIGTRLVAEAVPLHRGRRTQVWETRITNEQGRLVAKVTQTQMVL